MGEPGGQTLKGQRRKLTFWRTGVAVAKRELYNVLQLMTMDDESRDNPVFARVHAPMEYEEDYFEELTAEKLMKDVDRKGRIRYLFKCPERQANEALDVHVLNRVAAEILGLPSCEERDWEDMRKRIDRGVKKDISPERQARIDARKAKIAERVAARKRGS